MRSGSRTGLFDFRLGADIHVLVGCGLGGGSLINAGVALKPDARVFADPAWPEEVRDRRAARARLQARGVDAAARRAMPTRSELTKYRALETASAAFGVPPVAAPVVVSFEDIVNPAGVAQPACTLCGDCCSGCNVGAKNTVAMTYLPDAKAHGAEIFTELSVSHVAKDGGRLARLFRAVRREGRAPELRRCEDRRARRRHARLDRDPAPIARARARALRSARRGLLRQWRHHRLCPWREGAGERRRRRLSRRNSSATPSAPASRARSSSPTLPSSTAP